MAGRKRTTMSCPSTQHRRKKRCATRVTATPRHANIPPRPTPRIKSKEKEEIETTRDEYWALPLPTSPAPSPPRPHEICPILNCPLVGTPNETQVFTYRKLYNENNETLRDALGRETAGRHSFPASEFKRDRSFMTPSARAKKAHGIEYWPDPPFKFGGDCADGEHSMYVKYFERRTSLTPPSREPARMHTTGGRQVVRRPLRLFANQSGVGDGGMERDYEDDDDDVNSIEEEKKESLVHTAIGAQRDAASKSSYRKRRATKTPRVKSRRRLDFTCGSVKSDGVRIMESSREELIEDEEDENEEVEYGSNEPEREISYGMQSYLGNSDAVEGGDPNKTLEDIFVHTAIGVRGETASKSSTRERRTTSKDTVPKWRRSLYTGSVESDRVSVITSPEEEEMEDEEEENEGDDYGLDEPGEDGDIMIVEDGDPNKTLEEEKEESGDEDEEEGLGGEKMEESIELRVERSKERGDDNSVRIDGREGENEEEEEVVIVEDEDDDDVRESVIEEEVEQIDEIMNDLIEEESIQDDELSDHKNTSRQEINESEKEADYSDVMEKSGHNRSSVCDISLIDTTLRLESIVDSIVDYDLRRMLAVCKQDDVTNMDEFMNGVATADKVGEGSFADAYLVKRNWEEEKKVFKIIALRKKKNDEDEMDEEEENMDGVKKEEDAREVLGELVISKDLTRLGISGRNFTTAFAKLYRAKVIQGKFPPLLSDAWDRFYENDDDAIDDLNPKEYGEQQLFLVLECEYGGLSLKKFPFSSLLEIVSVYCQTALAIAVAESEFKFEHRDLHEDNVLVKRTEDGVIEFTFDCEEGNHKAIRVPTHGVKTTIIDFTLSRITRKPDRDHSMEDINVYHELTHDQCNQKADAEQYVVYNKMEKLTKGVWEKYTPKSNVLWLRMQINWIIKENCNPKSELNKKRLEAMRTRRTLKSDKKQEKKQPKKKSVDKRKSGVEEERTELSEETWMKKLKDGECIIRKLKSFSKGILKFDSAVDIVTSKEFESLLNLLVQ